MNNAWHDIDDSIRAQAAGFAARLSAEDASEADWLSLEDWLREDPRHLAAYEQVEAMGAEVAANAATLAACWPDDEVTDGVVDLAARRSPSRRWLVGGAAGAAAAAAVTMAFAVWPLLNPATASYETAAGETRVIALQDGSRISLNGASKLTVRYTRGRREVSMDDAEAAFDVAHDTRRPFVVLAGDTQIKVVGTEFNVRRAAATTEVAVRRGVVEVSPRASGSSAVRLAVGEQVSHRDNQPLAAVTTLNPQMALAWTKGQLVYNERPLRDVAHDISRRFSRPVRVDPQVADLRFTGVLVLDDQNEVVARLESFLPVQAHRAQDAITLFPR